MKKLATKGCFLKILAKKTKGCFHFLQWLREPTNVGRTFSFVSFNRCFIWFVQSEFDMVLVLQSRVLDLELKWVRWICCMWYYGVWLRHGYSMSCPYLCFRFVRLRSRSSSGEALSKLLSSLEGRLSFTAVCDGAIAAKICLIYLHAWFSGSVQRI